MIPQTRINSNHEASSIDSLKRTIQLQATKIRILEYQLASLNDTSKHIVNYYDGDREQLHGAMED